MIVLAIVAAYILCAVVTLFALIVYDTRTEGVETTGNIDVMMMFIGLSLAWPVVWLLASWAGLAWCIVRLVKKAERRSPNEKGC